LNLNEELRRFHGFARFVKCVIKSGVDSSNAKSSKANKRQTIMKQLSLLLSNHSSHYDFIYNIQVVVFGILMLFHTITIVRVGAVIWGNWTL